MPVRNDTLLNAHNLAFTLGWNANTDMSPCTNSGSVLQYIAKYASKSEVKSESYKELFTNVTERCSERAPFLSTAIRMMNRLIAERDWTAQEINHHLLGLELVESSREVIMLNLRPSEEQATIVEVEEGGLTKRGLSWLEKYTARTSYTTQPGVQIADISLFEFVREWIVEKLHVRRRPRALPRVLNLFPRYSRDPEGPEYEQYCRVKLMLHHPFSEPSELRMLDEDGVFSYATAYRLCRAEHEHPRDPLDPLEVEDEGESESEFESERDEAEPEPQAAWTDLAARNGRHDAQLADASDLENILGKRPQDIAYNWHASDHLYERVGEQRDFFEQARLLPEVTNRIRNDPSTLQGSQRTAFDTIIDHYRSCFTGVASRQLLLHIDGSAGTGKSYLIDMTSTYLFDMAQRNGHQDPVIRAAPTGVAAFGIQGQTLHRLLRLPVRQRFEPLSN